MKIGIDLDHTLYAFPGFFKAMIDSMWPAHQFFVVSGHTVEAWHNSDVGLLERVGIDPRKLDTSLMMATEPEFKESRLKEAVLPHKIACCAQLDAHFDDDAAALQAAVTIPIFCPPVNPKWPNKV